MRKFILESKSGALRFWEKLLDLEYWKKYLLTLLVFSISAALIYLLVLFTEQAFFFSLLVFPVFVTGFFYADKSGLIPGFLGTVTYLIIYLSFFGSLKGPLNVFVTTPIFFIISVSISYAGHRIIEWEKSEKRRGFLYTVLRQDLRSKHQTIQGYLQLLEEEADLPEEQREYLRKSMEAGKETDVILRLAKKLEKIKETEWEGEKDIVTVLENVIEDMSDLDEREGVEIEENYPEKISKAKGDYSLNTFFKQFLITRIQVGGCNRIRINASKREEDILLKIEDDGKQLPEDVKNIFTGEAYTGETTGAGGVIYYVLREIARHNNAEIEVQDSEMGGARFDVHLQKA